MKIAVPTKLDNQIDAHFGHCEFYTIFDIENNKINKTSILQSPKGCGCKSNIASELAAKQVKIMLAGGIGNGAVTKLSEHNINVIRNCKGDVHQLVNDYLAGKVTDGGANCSAHENHDDTSEHQCSH